MSVVRTKPGGVREGASNSGPQKAYFRTDLSRGHATSVARASDLMLGYRQTDWRKSAYLPTQVRDLAELGVLRPGGTVACAKCGQVVGGDAQVRPSPLQADTYGYSLSMAVPLYCSWRMALGVVERVYGLSWGYSAAMERAVLRLKLLAMECMLCVHHTIVVAAKLAEHRAPGF